MPEKRYTNGIFIKAVKTQYGSLLNVSLSKTGIEELFSNVNEKGYANLTIAERKEADKYGNTHYCFYNDYKAKQESIQPETEPETNDDLPF